jgi:ABC-2 type transport system permease protein
MTTTTLTPQHPRAYWLLADAAVLTGRAVRHTWRQIDGLLLSVMLPVMLLLLFVYVFGGAIDAGTVYRDYVIPGVIVLSAGYGASQVAMGVAGDLSTGTIDRFRSMPMSSASLLAGHVVSSVLRTLFSTVLVIAVALLIGFRPTTNVVSWLGVLGVTSLFVLAIAWISVAMGTMAKTAEAASGFTFFVLFLPYVSSAYVPVETLPSALRPIAEHQFVTPVIETMRGLLLDQPIGNSAWLAAAWCLGIIAITIPLSAALFRHRTRA